MTRTLSNESSLDNLKREAKRWLHALRDNDVAARERLQRAVPTANDQPTLRDVQHALAREHGFDGWVALTREVERIRVQRNATKPDVAVDDSSVEVDAELQAYLLAANKGDVNAVRAMLAVRPDLLNKRGLLPGHTGKRTALHHALGSPHKVAMVQALLEHGADPNIRDDGDNAFPLHFVAETRDLEIVRLLLDHGADTDGEGDYHELGVMGWATVFGNDNFDVARELLNRGAVHTLPSAVAMGNVPEIRNLLMQYPDRLHMKLDSANRYRTLLHLAVLKNQPDALDELIASGIDVEAEDISDLTALDQAALDGKREFAERLIQAGAVVRLPAAIALERADDVERILAANAHLLKTGQKYGQLFVQASERASANVIRTLLKYGADVNTRALEGAAIDNAEGYTALHAAAFHGNMGAVEVLLEAGANPRAREEKYCSTPAGWARHGKHHDIAARILQEEIDIFDAAAFNLAGRIRNIVARDPGALRRKLGEYVNCIPNADQPWKNPDKLPLDEAREWGSTDAEAVLRELLDASEKASSDLVSRFLRNASPDWRLTTGSDVRIARSTASRLLDQHPAIARENIFTAVTCGDVERVRELLTEDPARATEPDPDRNWPPLLFLSNTRLHQDAAAEHSVEIAQLLLERGADPNVFCPGGAELIGYDEGGIHFTALTNLIGRGEGRVTPHPRVRELAALLLEHGAQPYDQQVIYNVFAAHSSRADLNADTAWLLDLIYEHSVRLGRIADWKDPQWKMLDVGSYGPGAHFILEATVDTNNLQLTEWALQHGADPNVRSYSGRQSRVSLMDRAVRNGNKAMQDLLVRYGARAEVSTPSTEYELFIAACLSGDEATARQGIAQHPEWRRIPHALMIATVQDNADSVRLLLELGVSPDIEENAQRARALHTAVFRGSTRAAKVLLDAGADPDARELSYGSTPIGTASWAQQMEMVDLLSDYSRDLFNLVFAGRVDRVRQLLREDPSLAKHVERSGDTVLMRLPDDERDAMQLAELLIANGADPSIRNGQGLVAADIAERRGMFRVAALLQR